MGESLYSSQSCISKVILIQHIQCTQVSETGLYGPLVISLFYTPCVHVGMSDIFELIHSLEQMFFNFHFYVKI